MSLENFTKKIEESKDFIPGLDETDTRLGFLQEHIQTFYAQLKKLREEEEKAKAKEEKKESKKVSKKQDKKK